LHGKYEANSYGSASLMPPDRTEIRCYQW